MSRKVCIVGSQRIPFSRSFGKYMGLDNRQLISPCLNSLIAKFNLQGEELGEVVLGAVMKHSSEWNLARECVLSTQLSATTPAYDIQQACGTSLEAAILVANKIALGQIEVGIAGGVDTNSDLPIVFGKKFSQRLLKSSRGRSTGERLKPFLGMNPGELKPVVPGVVEPRTGLTMGQSCEVMAKEWKISRGSQDELAAQSHINAAKAYKEGFYDDLITPVNDLVKDNNLREDTTVQGLSQLKPAFDRKSGFGTLTAGNSTPLTDGASCALLASEEWAKKRNLPILAYLTHSQVAAVDFVSGEGLLMAPAFAVSRLLDRAQMSLQDFDFYEIHEAFAAQVLCTLRAWESEDFCTQKLKRSSVLGGIDPTKLNVKGGSLAVGHPFAATGTRIVGSLAKMLSQKPGSKGLISVCTAGGMGVTAILEGA